MGSRRERLQANRVSAEVVDPTPVEIPVSKHRPDTLKEDMMRFIRQEIANQQAAGQEPETFEEYNDIEPDDDDEDFTTPYTVTEMSPEEGGYLLEPEDSEPLQEQSADQESEEEPSPAEPSFGAEGTAEPPAPSRA